MFCTRCGVNNQDDAKFCSSCGNLLIPAETETSSDSKKANYNEENEKTYWESSQEIYNQNQQFTDQSMMTPPVNELNNMNQTLIQKKKSRSPLYILISVALVIIIIIIGFKVGSDKGLLDSLINAVKSTAKADSFEFEMRMTSKTKYGTNNEKVRGTVVYDLDKEKLDFDMRMDDDRLILYDGSIYESNRNGILYDYSISEELDDVFYYYKEYIRDFKGLSNIDWEESFDQSGLWILFDIDDFQACIRKLEKNLNSHKYLNDICNDYKVSKSSKGTTYSLDIDVPKFAKEVAENFDLIIDEYGFERELEYLFDDFDIFDDLEIDITIKDNKLANLLIYVSSGGTYSDKVINEIKLSFDKYGKASLNEKDIKSRIREYEYDY